MSVKRSLTGCKKLVLYVKFVIFSLAGKSDCSQLEFSTDSYKDSNVFTVKQNPQNIIKTTPAAPVTSPLSV